MITKSDINEGNFSFDDLHKLIDRIAELEKALSNVKLLAEYPPVDKAILYEAKLGLFRLFPPKEKDDEQANTRS